MPEQQHRIREFIGSRFAIPELADEQDIFALGFVNSLFAMELVLFLEKEMGSRIPNGELRMDNFRSINAMVALVDRVGLAASTQAGE